jgi:hypothetical protein
VYGFSRTYIKDALIRVGTDEAETEAERQREITTQPAGKVKLKLRLSSFFGI